MKLRFAAVLAALTFVACSSPTDEGPLDARVEIPKAPEPTEGVQLIGPELTVPAGEERMLCWVPEWDRSETHMVRRFLGLQSGLGHHLAAFKSNIPRQPGETFDCTNLESMVTIQPFLVPANPPGSAEVDPAFELFDAQKFAVRVPPDATLVMQSHYINVSEREMVIRDVAQLEFVPEDEVENYEEIGYFVVNHAGIDVGEGQHSVTATCTVDREIQLLSLLGHMHDWGTAILVEHERAGVRSELYRVDDWTVEFRDLAPVTRYDSDAPMVLQAGDTVEVTCSYNNDTGEQLRFPQEMCVGFGAFFGDVDEPFIVCE